jgi:hypothetical protein
MKSQNYTGSTIFIIFIIFIIIGIIIFIATRRRDKYENSNNSQIKFWNEGTYNGSYTCTVVIKVNNIIVLYNDFNWKEQSEWLDVNSGSLVCNITVLRTNLSTSCSTTLKKGKKYLIRQNANYPSELSCYIQELNQ